MSTPVPLFRLFVAILGNTGRWVVVAALGPQPHPDMKHLATEWPTLAEAQAAAARLAQEIGTDEIRLMPCQPPSDGPGAAA